MIYTLLDPTTNEVRYVGATHKESTRLTEHLSKARSGEKTHRGAWLRAVLASGRVPVFEVIERGMGLGWVEAEQRWIKHHREAGARLVNATDGGEGTLGYVPTEAARQKKAEAARRRKGWKMSERGKENLRAAQRARVKWEKENGVSRKGKKRSPETVAKMKKTLTGRTLSPEHRQKLSEVHQNPSEELREKWRQAVLNRPLEMRQAFASNQKGKPKSDETRKKMSEAAKQRWAREKQKKGAM